MNIIQFEKATSEVERIISIETEFNLNEELIRSADGINDIEIKRDFYRRMNTLFLNVLLNRLNQVGLNKEDIVIEARNILVKFINN